MYEFGIFAANFTKKYHVMNKSKIEIMAPAGSWEAMMAAIKAGADSVYFGIEQLNMRARSTNNFYLDDLKKIAQTCADNQVKSYLTLNTIIYDHDLNLMRNIVDEAKRAGITAIIASDLAVLNYGRKQKMPVHISTQTNITNIETIEFFADYADVMVMSRELTLQQVSAITREIKRRNIVGPSGELVRIEIFGHGALCMAVSGKCYLSLHTHNASANRGACIQNCRRSYVVTDKEEGYELEIDNEYIMSAKDLCTIDFLDKIIGAGIHVLKIEGRGRSADYVHTTTKCYREAADAIAEGTYTPEKIDAWMKELETVFNRGFWDGYYLGKKLGEWSSVYGSAATTKKIYIGKGVKYFDKIGVAEFMLESHNLNVNDQIIITGPTTGYVETTISELRLNGEPAETSKKGDHVSFVVPEKIRPSDKLYKKILVEA